MADVEDRRPRGAPRVERREEARPAVGVEPRVRLVEQQQPRLVDERPGEGEPLHHPAREAAHLPVRGPRQADRLQPALRPRVRLVGGDAVEPRVEDEVLLGREVVVQERLVPEVADERPLGAAPGARPADLDRAGAGAGEAGGDLQQRGLARAVRAEQQQRLARRDVERHVVERDDGAEAAGDPREAQRQTRGRAHFRRASRAASRGRSGHSTKAAAAASRKAIVAKRGSIVVPQRAAAGAGSSAAAGASARRGGQVASSVPTRSSAPPAQIQLIMGWTISSTAAWPSAKSTASGTT